MVITPVLNAAATCPAVSVEVLSGGGDVVVLAPHPDDETLGCGGAIAALCEAGRRVQVVVITDGSHSHPGSVSHPRARLCELRADEVRHAVRILTGGRGPDPILLGYPDNAAPDGSAAAQEAATVIEAHLGNATAVWSTWEGDPHPDHGRTARIARMIRQRNPKVELWSYPIWGRFADAPPPFAADRLVRFETHAWQDLKDMALAAHASQMSGLIGDDPTGFRMSDAMQRHFITTPELFFKDPS